MKAIITDVHPNDARYHMKEKLTGRTIFFKKKNVESSAGLKGWLYVVGLMNIPESKGFKLVIHYAIKLSPNPLKEE